jgi:hypothetical protein
MRYNYIEGLFITAGGHCMQGGIFNEKGFEIIWDNRYFSFCGFRDNLMRS